MKHRIIIVDDHTLVSNAIAELIEDLELFEVTHQVKHGRELIDVLQRTNKLPEIILLDINMPVMDGYETMAYVKEHYPNINVLALSMNDDDVSIIKMMKAGASGFISKQVTEDILLLALNQVLSQGYYYSDQVMKLVMNDFRSPNKNAIQFSDREKELLSYICSEMTYKEIADKMCLSPKTIDGYREDLFLKLDIKSRVGLAVFAMRNGFYK